MKIIEPSVEILTDIDRNKVLKHIEKCGRTCYQSYEKESENSAEKMVLSAFNKLLPEVFNDVAEEVA